MHIQKINKPTAYTTFGLIQQWAKLIDIWRAHTIHPRGGGGEEGSLIYLVDKIQ